MTDPTPLSVEEEAALREAVEAGLWRATPIPALLATLDAERKRLAHIGNIALVHLAEDCPARSPDGVEGLRCAECGGRGQVVHDGRLIGHRFRAALEAPVAPDLTLCLDPCPHGKFAAHFAADPTNHHNAALCPYCAPAPVAPDLDEPDPVFRDTDGTWAADAPDSINVERLARALTFAQPGPRPWPGALSSSEFARVIAGAYEHGYEAPEQPCTYWRSSGGPCGRLEDDPAHAVGVLPVTPGQHVYRAARLAQATPQSEETT